MSDKLTMSFLLCALLLSICFLPLHGCRHFDGGDESTARTAADIVIAPKPVKTKDETKKDDIVVYRGHEYVVYTVQGSYLGLTHSSDCRCTKKGD